MNIDNLERFVDALASVVGEYPEVDMTSIEAPVCGTPGCHAGLAYLALLRLGVITEPFGRYSFLLAADYLAKFLLGSARRDDLKNWAYKNRGRWGNEHGEYMFCSGRAFGQDSDTFPSYIILDHWRGVLARCRAEATREL